MTYSTISCQDSLNKLVQLAELKRVVALVENAMSEAPNKQLVITSPFNREGKTLFTAGLAVLSATRYNLRVLAVDLHWHSPGLHSCFSKEQNYDDSSMQSAQDVFTCVQETEIKGLDILAAPRDINENQSFMGQEICLDFLEKAESEYDRIIVDTGSIFPPNRFMMDPVYFAGRAGGTVMVVLGGVTPRDMAKKATFMFEYAGARLIGVVMNQWKNPISS